MKDFYTILGILLLMSCGNKSKNELSPVNYTLHKTISQKEYIHPILRKGIEELAKGKFPEEFPDIPFSESCLILSTHIEPESAHIYFSDSVISISYFICGTNSDYEFEGYKGILNVEGYNIAILDFENFADKYYNIDSLHQIPLKSFKCYPTKIIPGMAYYVENGELKHWSP